MKIYKKPFYEVLINFLLLNLGFTLSAMGYVFFLLPNMIVGGGATGASTVLYYLMKIPVPITLVSINLVLVILQAKLLNNNSSYKTIYVILVQPLVIQYLLKIHPITQITDDKMLACLFGGVLSGIGIGIVIKVGGSTGGTDILAQIMSKYLRVSVGKALTLIDFSVAISSGLLLNKLELALYGVITIFFTSKIIDVVQQGLNYNKVVYIISPQYQIISEHLMGELERGVTLINVTGMYTDKSRNMLMTVINKRQIFTLKDIVKTYDPEAFVIVTEAFSVMGRGFRQINENEE